MAPDTAEMHAEVAHSNDAHLFMSRSDFPGGVSALSDHETILSKQLHHLEAVLSSAGVHEVLQQVS